MMLFSFHTIVSYVFRVSHFNQSNQFSLKLLMTQKNISDESEMVSRRMYFIFSSYFF